MLHYEKKWGVIGKLYLCICVLWVMNTTAVIYQMFTVKHYYLKKKSQKKKKKKNSTKYKKHYTFLQKEYLTVWYATVPTSIFLKSCSYFTSLCCCVRKTSRSDVSLTHKPWFCFSTCFCDSNYILYILYFHWNSKDHHNGFALRNVPKLVLNSILIKEYVMRPEIWYNLCNLKIVKNTHGGVLSYKF